MKELSCHVEDTQLATNFQLRAIRNSCLQFLPFHLAFFLFFFFFVFLFFCFLGLHWRHMEVPRLGVQSELQLLTYTTATARPDLSHVCDLYHISWQCQTLNSLSKGRDQMWILMNTSWFYYLWATMGTSILSFTIIKKLNPVISHKKEWSFHLQLHVWT